MMLSDSSFGRQEIPNLRLELLRTSSFQMIMQLCDQNAKQLQQTLSGDLPASRFTESREEALHQLEILQGIFEQCIQENARREDQGVLMEEYSTSILEHDAEQRVLNEILPTAILQQRMHFHRKAGKARQIRGRKVEGTSSQDNVKRAKLRVEYMIHRTHVDAIISELRDRKLGIREPLVESFKV